MDNKNQDYICFICKNKLNSQHPNGYHLVIYSMKELEVDQDSASQHFCAHKDCLQKVAYSGFPLLPIRIEIKSGRIT